MNLRPPDPPGRPHIIMSNDIKRPQIIDAHTHAWLPEDLVVVHKSRSLLDRKLPEDSPHRWSLILDGTIESLVSEEVAAGVDRLVILPTASQPERCRALSRWSAQLARENPRVIPFGSLHPLSEDQDRDMEELLESGPAGVKLHSLVQRFDPLSPEAFKVYGFLEKNSLPVLMDSMDLTGAVEVKPNLRPLLDLAEAWHIETGPPQIVEIAERFPNLKIVAAHMGCLYGWDRIEPLYEIDQIYFDLAFVHPLLSPKQALEIIRAKGPNRIIFGTDAPYRRPGEALEWFYKIPLSPVEQARILSENLLEIIGRPL